MSIPLWCLLAFVAWTMSLMSLGIGVTRVIKVLKGEAKSNDFPTHKPHGGSERYQRTMRAHLNCVENLPLFGAVVLIAALTNLTSGHFDVLALVYLASRVGQSIAHIASGSATAVNVRFTLFLTQILALLAMGVILAIHHGS